MLYTFDFVNGYKMQAAPIPADNIILHQMYFTLPNLIDWVRFIVFISQHILIIIG